MDLVWLDYSHITRGAMILDVAIPELIRWDEVKGDAVLGTSGLCRFWKYQKDLSSVGKATFLLISRFAKFARKDIAHPIVGALPLLEQLHAAFEMYRAFPANGQFNATQDENRDDEPVFVGSGERWLLKVFP